MADIQFARSRALEVIDFFGISAPEEIDLEAIAWHKGIDIKEGKLTGSEAELIRKKGAGVIRIRSGEKETPRGRFSIAHELGHWELHEHQSQLWLCTGDMIHEYAGSDMEIEANAFAAELLMPTPIFRPICRKGTFSFRLADHLSSLFKTSLQATALRMVEETDEPAIVVLTDGEQVLWSNRNQKKLPDYDFHIQRGTKLHPDSLAWSATLEGDMTDTVEARHWFPNLKDAYRFSLQEDVRYIEVYELTLSLLTLYEE